MGYIKTIIAISSGLKCFPKLVGTSLWKVLFHYLLTVMAAAIIITIGRGSEIKASVNVSKLLAVEEFGELTESGLGGFSVEKEPERARLLALPRGMNVLYLPSAPEAEAELPDFRKDAVRGLIFTPAHLIMWFDSGETRMFLLAPPPNPTEMFKPIAYTDENLRTLLALPAPELTYQPGTSPAASFLALTDQWLPLTLILWFVLILVQTFAFLLVVALIFGTIGVSRISKLISMKEMFVLTFYPALPALLVAAFLPALGINTAFFDFNLVFLLGAMTYMMFATNYVAARRLQAANRPNGQGDDSDE